MRRAFTVLWFLILPAGIRAQWVTNHNPIFQGLLSQPLAGETYVDRAFDVPVRRLTDARATGLAGVVPQYSKRQAWNADESLLLLFTTDGTARLYDGSSYAFLKTLEGLGGEDVFWHPTDPELIYYCPDSVLHRRNVATDADAELRAFTDYTFANTRGEGNLSLDGRFWAFAGVQYLPSSGDLLYKDIVVYDIAADSVVAKMPLPQGLSDFDWVSISPLGDHVVIDYATERTGRYNGVEVYDRTMNFLWQKPLGYGHSDLGLNAGGEEVLVMDYYDSDSNLVYLNAYRLADGKQTTLLSWSPFFDSHESCRNEQRRGWCTVSTFDSPGRLTDDSTSWLPFEDEVFQVKMDGSREVRRIAHHRSRRFSPSTPDPDNSRYFAEPHATISRKGDRILWGSNWRDRVGQDESIDAYLADLRGKIGTFAAREAIPPALSLEIYPHPARGSLTIRVAGGKPGHASLRVRDLLGREVDRIFDGDLETGAGEFRWSPPAGRTGLFLIELRSGGAARVGKILLRGTPDRAGR